MVTSHFSNLHFFFFSCKTTYGRREKDFEEKVLGHEILISTATNGCAFMGGVLHQILHALGFAHEHARDDRDKYVEVHSDNIKPGVLLLYLNIVMMLQK